MRPYLLQSDKISLVEKILNPMVIQKYLKGFVRKLLSYVLIFLKQLNNLQVQSLLPSPTSVGNFIS